MRCIFKLYVAGESAISRRAVGNLKILTAHFPPETCQISVIDIMKDPERAAEKHIAEDYWRSFPNGEGDCRAWP